MILYRLGKLGILILILFLSGCISQNPDAQTIYLLNQRIQKLEKVNSSTPRSFIEIRVNEILPDKTEKEKIYKIEVIVDQDGNFIIPQDKIVKRFELKNQ